MTKETIFSRLQLGVRGSQRNTKCTRYLLSARRGLGVGSSFMPSLYLNRLMGQGISLSFPLFWEHTAKPMVALPTYFLSSSTEPRQLLCCIWGATWLSAQLVLLRNEELRMALNTWLTLLR